jgi:tetratricopeptide (TPR) repeat protein
MEQRTVSGGDFALFVPKGWRYQPPDDGGHPHVFRRDGVGIISVALVPQREAIDAAAFATSLAERFRGQGAERLARRELTVGSRTGIELLFRRGRPLGAERIRLVVFVAAGERLFHVTCVCAERRYRLLEAIFDKVIQSIEPRLPVPRASGAQEFWQRLAEDPSDVEAYVLLAAFYRIEGRYAAAEQALRTAIKLKPRYADAHDQLAYLLATAAPPHRRPELAVKSANRAIHYKPDSPKFLATLAIAHEAAGDRAKALAAARKAAALAPDDASYADLVKRLSRKKGEE